MGLFNKQQATGARSGLFSRIDEQEDPYNLDRVNRSIDNARLRIQDAGFDPGDTDKRNWFEKATNLPQGQNFLFDTLELLGRPAQALLNVVDKSVYPHAGQEEQNVGRALWEGLSGKERVRGSELVERGGVNNKALQAVLGTGLEIAADPLTYVPGGVLLKGAKGATNLATAPVRGAYNALEAAAPSLRAVRENQITPRLDAIKDALGYMFNPQYKQTETLAGGQNDFLKNLSRETENTRRYMQEESLKGISNAAKQAGGIDTGMDVGRLMEAPLRQFEDVKGYEFPDSLRRTTDKADLLDEMNVNRESIRGLGKEVNQIRRDYDKGISETASLLEKTDKEIRRYYFSAENKELRKLNNRKNVPVNIDDLAAKAAMGQVSLSPKFNLLLQRRDEIKKHLDDLRINSEKARAEKITEIQSMVGDNDALRESTRNPIMLQQEIQRPQRDLPTSPEIQQASKQLMQSNVDIRKYAEDNGISIPELEGYMTHVLSAAEREFRKRGGKASKVDAGSFNTGNPNKSLLKNRELMGSAEDINERMVQQGARPDGHNFFEPNAYFATGIGQKRLIDYIQAVQFRRKVLSNPDFARKIKEGERVTPGKNQAVIDTNNYTFLKDDGDLLSGLATEVGGKYLVTNAVKSALDRFQHLNTDEGTKAFIKAFDATQNQWKKLALFSPGYHIRNLAGAMFNNYIAGMNTANLAKYTTQAAKEVKDAVKGSESALFNEYRKQGLSSSSLSGVEFLRSTDPEKSIEKTIKSRSSTNPISDRINPLNPSTYKNAFETSREAGDFIDQVNRFALYKWARDKGLTPEQAAEKVREVQFDYSNITPFEKKVTRLVPFYRWMRNNIPFQINQFITDPRKYQNVNKLRLNAQEAAGIDDENVADFMKESFAIPVYGDDEGKGKMLGLNLPLADLTKLSNPVKMLLDALTPLGKLPAEYALNRSFFYDKPIQEFEGQQKKFEIPQNFMGIPIPGGGTDLGGINQTLAYIIEQLGGQPARTASNLFQSPESADQAKKFKDPVFGINSLLKDFDTNKAIYFQQQEQLRALQDLIDYIEQQTGVRPRGVNEIK